MGEWLESLQSPEIRLDAVEARVRCLDGSLMHVFVTPERIQLGDQDGVILIVRDLRAFSRPDDGQHGPVDVRRAVEYAVGLAWSQLRERARLVRRLGDVPPGKYTLHVWHEAAGTKSRPVEGGAGGKVVVDLALDAKN